MKINKIFQAAVAVILPVVYFYLMGGFNSTAPSQTEQVIIDPLSVISRDFLRYAADKKIQPTGLCGKEKSDSASSVLINRLVLSQRLDIKVIHDTSHISGMGLGFRKLYGYFEKDSGGKEIIYVSTGNYEDGRTPLQKGYIAQNVSSGKQSGTLLHSADIGSWYLKPSLKIRKADFSPADTRPVAAVVTVNFEGKVIDSTILKVRNFSDLQGKYDGGFKNRFMTEYEKPSDNFSISNREMFAGSSTSALFDIKIYWFGEVDLWLEKVMLDDEIANQLLEGQYTSKIIESSSPGLFDCVITGVCNGKYSQANSISLNYVLNIMSAHLNKTAN